MKTALLRTAAVVGVLVLLLSTYGVTVEPRFILDERHETVAFSHLPRAWDGAEIAVFSDLQIGMWWSIEGMIERIVDRTVPAAVLVAAVLGKARSASPAPHGGRTSRSPRRVRINAPPQLLLVELTAD